MRTTMSRTTARSGVHRRIVNQLIPALLAAVVSLAASASAAQPQPVLSLSGTQGMAPYAVHVHATDSSLGAGSPLTARYEWDFGDPDGRYNTLEGFNAAHLYEQPGEYTITLRITNENGQQKQTTRTVTVQPDSRSRLYVSPSGSDSNSGHSASQPLRTIGRALQLLNDNTRILLRRDGVYNISNSRSIDHSNVLLADYGSGSRPKLNWVGPLGYQAILNTTGGVHNAVVRNIIFTSNWPADYDRDIVDGVRPAGENITIVDCKFRNVSLAINGNQQPRYLLALDCHADVIGAYFIWADGDDYCAIGNTVDGSHFEHCIRIGLADRILIHDNELANDDKRSIWGMHGSYMYVSDNRIDQGRMSVGPDPFGGSTPYGMTWTVFEGNDILRNTGGNGALECLAGSSKIMIRNNVLRVNYLPAINISGYSSSTGMRVEDVLIYNNTGINTSDIGRFLSTNDGSVGISVRNNLYVAPNLVTGDSRTANVYVDDDDLASFTEIARNVWAIPDDFHWVPDGYHYVWPGWSNAEGYRNPAEWLNFSKVDKEAYAVTTLTSGYTPQAGSTAADHARPLPGVHTDFHGNLRRSSGKWSAGAVEIDPADGPQPDPDPDPEPGPGPDGEDVAFYDNFQVDRGWLVDSDNLIDGAWARGVPAGHGDRGDPEHDFDGSGKCWVTGNRPGNSDVDGGPTILTSPVFDLTEGTDPYVSFARWIYCNDGSDDRIITEVSNNAGASWTQMEIASSTGDWRRKEYRLSDFVTPTSQVQVRFVISDDGNNSITEAGIDDFLIRYESMDEPEPPSGDVNGDGTVDINDLFELLDQMGACSGDCSADLNGDGMVDVDDLLLLMQDYLP